MNDAAIFRSTQQALHVSYLIASEPAREKAAFRLTLIKIIESIGALTREQAKTHDYLIGTKTGTVNFDGLNPLEIRAQAAMVIACVNDQLGAPERSAIVVHYGRGREKGAAVESVSRLLAPKLNIENRLAVMYLIGEQSLAKNERDPQVTFKFISEKTGVPIRTLERAAHTIRRQLRTLENTAYDTLTPVFERDGLVERL